MAFYGVGIDTEVSRLICDIKMKLANKYGCYGLRQLDLAYKRNDLSGSGHVAHEDFITILNGLGVFCKQIDYQALTKYFGRGHSGIDYTSFVNRFRQPLTPARETMVQQVFERLDVNRSGALCPTEVSKPC